MSIHWKSGPTCISGLNRMLCQYKDMSGGGGRGIMGERKEKEGTGAVGLREGGLEKLAVTGKKKR